MSTTGTSTTELRALVKRDTLESEHLQLRIDQLRHDILAGIPMTQGNVLSDVELQAKKMGKDLARRIEEIEGKDARTATDREYLQALNARQVVWDRQIMQAAELRELMFEALKGPRRTGTRGGDHDIKKTVQVAAEKSAAPAVEMLVDIGSPVTPSIFDTAASDVRNLLNTAAAIEPVFARRAVTSTESPQGGENPFEGEGSEEDEQLEPDKSTWPICYRILDIDPATEPRDFETTLIKAYKKLARGHDPKFRPNDPDAADRWASISKAYELLKDPERRESYDRHGWCAAELVEFDMARLEIK
ncbi:hypothetical protein LTR35_000044 [Friedmanniomyces endolithicus]|uniref:J domain-containing protein n=1 Tax=Friedmanniomyces endolithicus TaxID=329885 RepID=A0AAN6FK68_9PEZI|nr:hypothetical protein LTS00_008689 [Friedmanniomyces endolithicus]KAK0293440.1 hypothetical protein LTR35_000044 [Friedmanniomyces endolithicus]KAK0318984.1 hypothetical protein LTR82_010084 [Friedmanniomyces endolithicus]KAK0997418.1 hypothetical protein LTR54_009878 [Friedmanniomyces endolithicus]